MNNSLGTWFRRQPVRRKLTATVLSTSAVTLIAACVVFATYDYIDARSRLVRDVTLLADMLGTNSIAPLTFNDATAAAETLRATAVNEHIDSARLFMPRRRAARQLRAPRRPATAARDHDGAGPRGAVFEGDPCTCAADRPRPRVIGTISVQSDTAEISARTRASSPSSPARCSARSGSRSSCRTPRRG